MKTLEWTTVDKRAWGEGPWQNEPDKRQWQDEETGLPCLINRGPSGALCGYVGVLPTHIAYGRDYYEVDVNVHGGLTFADRCQPNATEESGICHIVESGEPDNVWWLGFDCSHGGDVMPAYKKDMKIRNWHYRDITYVTSECKSLAKQLSEMDN